MADGRGKKNPPQACMAMATLALLPFVLPWKKAKPRPLS